MNESWKLVAAAAAMGLVAVAGAGEGDPVDLSGPRPGERYEGRVVVRVEPTTPRQLRGALEIAETAWSHRTGLGPIDLQVTAKGLEALRAIGLEPEVVVPDVSALLDREWEALRAAAAAHAGPRPRVGEHDPAYYASYHQLADVHAYMNQRAAFRPDLATVEDVGDGIELVSGSPRDVLAIRVTGPDQPGNLRDDRPVVLWIGGQHAREWISPATTMYLADMLIHLYDTDTRVRDLVDNVDFRIIPVCNPDGYVYTWTSQRLWRKNRRGGYGVDLNRNWAYQWGGDGSSGSTSSDTYRGSAPFSEPETQALRDYSLSFGTRLAAAIDYHSYSQLILWPYGYATGAVTPEPDRTFFDTLATDMSVAIQSHSGAFYDPIQSWELYPASGTSDDWWYGQLGVWGMAIELRDTGTFGFELPQEYIVPTAEENWEAALLFAERTSRPMSFSLVEALPGFIPADEATPVQVVITNGTETLDAPTATLHARVGAGGFSSIPMTALGGGAFGADLPAAPCGDEVEFYFSAQTTQGSTVTLPSGGGASVFAALAQQETLVFDDDMEANLGWTVGAAGDGATSGVWQRADPQGTSAQPENDHTPVGTLCFVTGSAAGTSVGTNDVDGGTTTLTSPTLDAVTGEGDAYLSYWRWYSNDQGSSPNEDSMPVRLSNDGGATWVDLEVVSDNAGAWVFREVRVADYLTPTGQMRLRFVAGDLGGGSIVEAGVDDVAVTFRGCAATNPADCDGNGELNLDDVTCFADAFLSSDLAADCDGNGELNLDDVTCFAAAFTGG